MALLLVCLSIVFLVNLASGYPRETRRCINQCARPHLAEKFGEFFCNSDGRYHNLTRCITRECLEANGVEVNHEKARLARHHRDKFCDDHNLKTLETTVKENLSPRSFTSSDDCDPRSTCDPTMVAVAKGLCTVGGLAWCDFVCQCGEEEYFFGILKTVAGSC